MNSAINAGGGGVNLQEHKTRIQLLLLLLFKNTDFGPTGPLIALCWIVFRSDIAPEVVQVILELVDVLAIDDSGV